MVCVKLHTFVPHCISRRRILSLSSGTAGDEDAYAHMHTSTQAHRHIRTRGAE